MEVLIGTEAILYTREGRHGSNSAIIDPFNIVVIILDERKSFTHMQYLVTPKFGEGQLWVSENRMTFRVKDENGELVQHGRERPQLENQGGVN